MRMGVIILAIMLAGILSCRKDLTTLYASTQDITLSAKGDTCIPVAIAVTNLNSTEERYSLTYVKPIFGEATGLSVQNNVTNTQLSVSRILINDTLSLFNGDSVFINKGNQLVNRIVTRKNPLQFKNDRYDYRFVYKDSFLIQKTVFVNFDTTPYFITTYTHDLLKSQLIGLTMRFVPDNRVLFESKLSYDKTYRVKPWIYLYTDFFSMAEYLLVFNFGKRTTGLVTAIESVFYENGGGTPLGTWKTAFSAYKLSKDNHVMNFNCAGPRIDPLPYLYQNVQFSYQCK